MIRHCNERRRSSPTLAVVVVCVAVVVGLEFSLVAGFPDSCNRATLVVDFF